MINRQLAFFFYILFSYHTISAQRPVSLTGEREYYFRATELYTQKKYNAAQHLFQEFILQYPESQFIPWSEFYSACCAEELHHPDATERFTQLSVKYIHTPIQSEAQFHILKILFREKKYKNFILETVKTDLNSMSKLNRGSYLFMRGFSHYKLQQYQEALNDFNQINDESDTNYIHSSYYAGYIYYLQNKPIEAEQNLIRTLRYPAYATVVPLYLGKIYIQTERYAEAVSITDTIKHLEIRNDALVITATASYLMGDYFKSADRYNIYIKNNGKMNDSDWYMAGKSNNESDNFSQGIFCLSKIRTKNDTLSQNVNYELGYAFLKTGLKENARNAYKMAYQNISQPLLAEEAGYFYNLLSAELYTDHVQTIEDLTHYINIYKSGTRTDVLKDILSGMLLNSRQFKKTLEILEPMENKTQRVKTVIQKSAYCLGEENLKNGKETEAENYFKKSLEYATDERFTGLAGYWLGDIAYKSGNFSAAISRYEKCIKTTALARSEHYATCFYNLGWCYFKQQQYGKAIQFFNEYNEIEDYLKKDLNMLIDGHVRLADCYYMQKNYDKALSEYNWVISRDNLYHDYALYQKGTIQGLLGKPYEKIATLTQLAEVYEESDYLEKSLYELGYTSFYLEKFEDALDWFDQLISKKKNGNEVRRAHLNIGLIFKRQGKTEKAIEQFQFVVKKYQQSEEGREALVLLKQLCIDAGRLSTYNTFIQSIPGLGDEYKTNDSDAFEAVENSLRTKDTVSAVGGLNDYIANYPAGVFILKSRYFRAEILYRKHKQEEALPDYEWIALTASSEYTEKSVRYTAMIYFDKKDFAKALPYYKQLEQITSQTEWRQQALTGQFRCAQKLNQPEDIFNSGKKILARADMSANLKNDVKFEMANRLRENIQQPESLTEATRLYSELIKTGKNERAAVSKYYLAWIQFQKNEITNARKTIKELKRDYSDYEFWVAKGLLLMADIYLLQGDSFQTRATLNSLIENFEPAANDPEDIIKLAKESLRKMEIPTPLAPKKEEPVTEEEDNNE